MRIAQHVGRLTIDRHLDDALANRLLAGFGSFKRQIQTCSALHLRGGRALDHLDPRRPGNRGEVIGRGLDLLVGHLFGDIGHGGRIALLRLAALAGTRLEVVHGVDEVLCTQARYWRVLGPALAVGIVAQRTGDDAAGRIALLHDRRHQGVLVRVPVRRAIGPAADLGAGKALGGARQGVDLGVHRRRCGGRGHRHGDGIGPHRLLELAGIIRRRTASTGARRLGRDGQSKQNARGARDECDFTNVH